MVSIKSMKFLLVARKYWWLIALLIVIVPVVASSWEEARENNDYRILFYHAGEGLVAVDTLLHEKLADNKYKFEEASDLEDRINKTFDFSKDLFLDVWKYVWLYLAIIVSIYKTIYLIFYQNVEKSFVKCSFVTLLFVAGLQLIVSGVPFEGAFLFLKTLWGFFSSW